MVAYRGRSAGCSMDDEKTLRIRVVEPTARFIEMLRPAIECDPTADAAQVIAGGTLCVAAHAGHDVAAFLLRQDGPEIVVVAAVGALPGVSLLDAILPHIEATTSAKWIRIHSSRRGMARQLARHGYTMAEVVYRKEINRGR